jgi:hypothetical protein
VQYDSRAAAAGGRLSLRDVPADNRPFRRRHSNAPRTLILHEDRGLRWFDSSATARRGFCQFCGSNLFWAPADGSRFSIMAGTLDKPTGLAIAVHIFVNDASDYYRIADGLPQRTDGEHGVPLPPL